MGIDLNKIKQIFDDANSKAGAGIWRFTPKAGDNSLRLMPPWTDEGDWANLPMRRIFVHWVGSGQNADKRLCLKKTFGEPCPVCDEAAKLRGTGSPADAALASSLRPQEKYISNVVDLNDPVYDDGRPKMQLWEYGPMIYNGLATYIMDAEYGDISDPDEGFTIKLTRKGTNMSDTRYDIRCGRAPMAIGDYPGPDGKKLDQAAFLSAMTDLDKIGEIDDRFAKLPYDAMQQWYLGTTDIAPTMSAPVAAPMITDAGDLPDSMDDIPAFSGAESDIESKLRAAAGN